MKDIPDFDSLPKVEGQPQGCSWGLWGKGDQLGSEHILIKLDLCMAGCLTGKDESSQQDHARGHFGC